MPDDQDRAEALDDEKLGGEYPPERPLGAHRRQDDAIPESFAGREARTLPDADELLEDPEARAELNADPTTRREAVEQELASEGRSEDGADVGDHID